MTNKTISIIIPAYNEVSRIETTLSSIARYIAHNQARYEVIVVDDGSVDGTPSIAEQYSSVIKNFTVLVNNKNKGKGFSVRRGMLAAKGDYRLFMDADNSIDIAHLDKFINAIDAGCDVAIGSIYVSAKENISEHSGLHRRFLGFCANILIQAFAVWGIKDTQRGFKLFSKEAADVIFPLQKIERFGFDIEVLVIARKFGFLIKELPVVWNNPAGSKVTLVSYFQTLNELTRIITNRLLQKYSPHNTHPSISAPQHLSRDHAKGSLGQRMWRFVFSSEHEKHMVAIVEHGKTTGFHYKGNEFIHHTGLHYTETAFVNLLRHQKVLLITFGALIVISFISNWRLTGIILFGFITILYFFDLLFNAFIVFRSYKVFPEIQISNEEITQLRDEDCPSYTIFCPLYKEWHVVPQFVDAMQKLDYPHDKLQILFLLEENDKETIQKISQSELPPHFQIVVVPHSKPKTKPKAMNYGLNYASGEYLVVYDAEDVPEVNQLKKAVLSFAKVKSNVACIQAKLNYYNPRQNLLTRLFTTEYSLWFDLVLPGLQSIGAPIPLGGTSNHFRTNTLRELDGWDAFNVTEDCDLGMRMAKRGYKTAIVDSTTYEEANSDPLNWYNQRSRWIKGYIQTYFVHMRDPRIYFAAGKGRDFFLFQLIVGGKILSLFINPIMWMTTICYFLFRAKIGVFVEAFFPDPILYIGVFSLIFGNFLYLYYYMVGCVKRGYDELIKYVFLIPLYWLGMSLAAWKALYEIVVKPHYWSKTVHGLHLAPSLAQATRKSDTIFDIEEVLRKQPPRWNPTGSVIVPKKPVMQTMTGVTPFASPTIPQKHKAVQVKTTTQSKAEPELIRLLGDDASVKRIGWFGRLWKFTTSSAGLFVLSAIAANILNLAFNIYLGRNLSLDEFAVVSIMSTFVSLLNLFAGSLSTTITHSVSYLDGKRNGQGTDFYLKTKIKLFTPSLVASVLWLLLVPVIANLLNISSYLVVASFGPAILFGIFSSFYSGYLQGVFAFGVLALLGILEAFLKLIIAVAVVQINFAEYAVLAVPLSIFVAWAGYTIAARKISKKVKKKIKITSEQKKFPLGFYAASLVRGVSVVVFLSIDLLLAKHYLNPTNAGIYSILSLVGKMIFFFGSLLNRFIIPIVSRMEGGHMNASREFAKLFAGTTILTVFATLSLVVGGQFFVPFLLGNNAVTIIPYIPLYSLAIALFTLSSTIVLYGLLRKRYVFPALSLMMSFVFALGIVRDHASVESFVNVMMFTSALGAILIFFTHLFYENLIYLARNVRDILLVVKQLPPQALIASGKKRILIFNWRDIKSVYAGGAETYIHALASRLVAEGNSVTLFTSNDGHLPSNDKIDGVRIIRRGGFYAVYPIAFVYYIFHFRGKFDVIIDSENGIPFFTPLFAREPVHCLVHHIHQEVFRTSLLWPFATLACFLEKVMMPLVYRNSNFITVSESSRKEMQALNITDRKIEIVNPGINEEFLTPGKKSITPTIAYVGRLTKQKSVDVLLYAMPKIITDVAGVKLVIAGGGGELSRLKQLAKKLQLEDYVTFLGKVTEDEKRDVLRSAWVFVAPSRIEGWGITTIEANACGTPVVASNVSGLRDSVRDGETGILVPYGDISALAKKVTHILTDNAFRNTLSANSIKWAKNFGWDKSSEKFIKIISSRNSSCQYDISLVNQT